MCRSLLLDNLLIIDPSCFVWLNEAIWKEKKEEAAIWKKSRWKGFKRRSNLEEIPMEKF